MRRVRQRMGMPVTIDIPGAVSTAPFTAVYKRFKQIDERFSPFKPTSELMRYRTGQVAYDQLSEEMRTVIAACTTMQKRTEGYFSAFYNGDFDPTGYVKGWAIAQAGQLLEEQGITTYMLNVAGDILARSASGHIWHIGLQHPTQPNALLGTIAAKNIAVATSGIYAQGNHIYNPHTGKPATHVLSVTITGQDIVMADAFATAVCAMGVKGLDYMEKQPGYQALLIQPDLRARTTHGFGAARS